MKQERKLQIRNSTAEFLIFTRQAGQDGIEVRVADNTVWLTQKLMAVLFEVTVPTINEHLTNLYSQGEVSEGATLRKFRIVQQEGRREVERTVEFYNLDTIIAVGFRVNSVRAIQFRQWATGVLRDFAIRGYVLDKERLKNGAFLSQEYFTHLLAEIREIRASERNFYQKITDIYATAMDYRAGTQATQTFFATVQNKLHFAIHGHTAAELIIDRADNTKERMGLTTWRNAPRGKILKPDVVVAKNYLTQKELTSLDRFVTMYLDYAEDQAERKIPMTMKDWAGKLNAFLQFNERDILDHPGKVRQAVAKAFAESEFEKYRIVQDRLFESDFDKVVKELVDGENGERPLEFVSPNCPEEDKLVTISNDEIIKYCEGLKSQDWIKKATKTQTIKDIVAHLVGWQRECVFELEKTWNSGVQPWFGLTDDYDEFNARIRGEFHPSKPSELLEEFRHWDFALNKTIAEIGEDKLRAKSEFDWVMDEGEDSHFLNHFLQIKKAVEGV